MEPISIYIHFPYCQSKCPYCDFNSHVTNNFYEKELLECYKKEIDFFLLKIGETRILRSIFFGGGTPSLMNPETIQEIINYIFSKPELQRENVEITLEANPSSSEYAKFENFKKSGINRLSIGVQSLVPRHLEFLERKHSGSQAVKALEMAKSIFQEFSFDLIYCLPGQTLRNWIKELSFAVENYAKNHISAYTLTIEKGTPFYKMYREGKFNLPPQEENFYFTTNKILKSYGLERYEISNYAKKGSECHHNLSYWQTIDYLGIGPGAHGRITTNGKRFESCNFALPSKYISLVNMQGNALQKYVSLTEEDIIKEALIMNLRTTQGININMLQRRFGINLYKALSEKKLIKMQEEGLLNFSASCICLTSNGLNVAFAIASALSS